MNVYYRWRVPFWCREEERLIEVLPAGGSRLLAGGSPEAVDAVIRLFGIDPSSIVNECP